MKPFLSATLLLSLLAPSFAATTTQPADTKVDLPTLLPKLASNDLSERDAAERAIVRAFWWQGPEIEAASKNPGLDPDTAIELQHIVSQQKPRMAFWARVDARRVKDLQANQTSALAAYDKVGRKNPAWDDTARQFIRTFTEIPDAPKLREKRLAALSSLRDSLKKAGCDDPFIQYLMVRSHDSDPDPDFSSIEEAFRDAVKSIEASDYSPYRKCMAHAKYADYVIRNRLWEKMQISHDAVTQELDRAVELWPLMVKSDELTDDQLFELAGTMEQSWLILKAPKPQTRGDRAALCDKLFPSWQQARPDATGPWVYKGRTYIDYAWDARGGGWANTVSQNGWALMSQRLAVARQALEKAYALDPTDPRAPTSMITVELGDAGDHGGMELWWMRAMEANPDNMDACYAKLYFLEPKWHGSAPDMIRFGRECLKAGNWEGRIPFILVEAHHDISAYFDDPSTYYARPDVWADLRSVYEPYLSWYPNSTYDRSYFAYYASLCGQWAEAHKQFTLLGDNVDLAPFKTQESLNRLRRKAQQLSTPTSAPTP